MQMEKLVRDLGDPRPDTTRDRRFPSRVDRDYESRLLALAASGTLDPAAWLALGPTFFMAGLAATLASGRGADRDALLALADELQPGMSRVEVFNTWLQRSPVRPSRFLPMLREKLANSD